MPLSVLVIDRAPPLSLRQGNALIGIEVMRRMRHHDLTLVAPATPAELESAQQLDGIFGEVHLVRRNRWTPALAGSIEPALVGRLRHAPGLDLEAARALGRCISEVTANRTFDVVHVRQLPMAGYARLLPDTGRLLELIDSETLGAERARPATWRTRLRALLAAREERQAMRGFDIVTTVADADAERLRALGGATRVDVVPNGVDAERFHPDPGVDRDPGTIVFVGAMSFPPNVAAMRWFTREVLPRIHRVRPDARLTIVGRDPSVEVRALSSASVAVTGEVEDVRPFLAGAAVFVAPMVSGSGIKNKVLEAMSMECPVAATGLAVEGLPVRSGEDAIVAEGPAGMAAAVLRVLDDPAEGSRIGAAGRELVERRYTWAACAVRYEQLYEELASRRGSH
ncbi:MAG: glycosyltransferase [Candidatus Limnocylindria bacterium]